MSALSDRRSASGGYTVTFTLTGFSTSSGRKLVQISRQIVNAEMRIGALEETITVSEHRRSSTCRRPEAELPRSARFYSDWAYRAVARAADSHTNAQLTSGAHACRRSAEPPRKRREGDDGDARRHPVERHVRRRHDAGTARNPTRRWCQTSGAGADVYARRAAEHGARQGGK